MAGILYFKKGHPPEFPVAADHELVGYQELRAMQTRAFGKSILPQMPTERTKRDQSGATASPEFTNWSIDLSGKTETGRSIMRVRRSIIAAAAAVALGTTGALLAPAAASAHSAAQTLTFTSVARNFVSFTSTTFAEQDTDVSAAGTVIGFDEVTVTFGTAANTADIAFALNGGLLDGTFTISRSTGAVTGAVTGGTGSFAGATGTITGTSVAKKKEAITITYST